MMIGMLVRVGAVAVLLVVLWITQRGVQSSISTIEPAVTYKMRSGGSFITNSDAKIVAEGAQEFSLHHIIRGKPGIAMYAEREKIGSPFVLRSSILSGTWALVANAPVEVTISSEQHSVKVEMVYTAREIGLHRVALFAKTLVIWGVVLAGILLLFHLPLGF